MYLRVLVFLALAFSQVPARADHDSAESILRNFLKSLPGAHLLAPAKTIRIIPASQNRAVIDRITPGSDSHLKATLSVLVIQDGEFLYENYANGALPESKVSAYSMTKSLTALAVGEALCAGKIKSLDDAAHTYAPQLAGTAYGAASVRQLLAYTSGAQDPGGNGYLGIHSEADFDAVLRYRLSLVDLMKKYGAAGRFKAGEKFIYNGLDSEALSVVVREATGLPLPQWFEQTVWQKAGAEFWAGWKVDRDGNGVAETAFHATARDFARIGLYMLERLTGKTDDACMSAFLVDAAKLNTQKGYWEAAPAFGLGLHIGADSNIWMFGHGGQRVGMNLKNGRVVATNGFKEGRGFDQSARAILSR